MSEAQIGTDTAAARSPSRRANGDVPVHALEVSSFLERLEVSSSDGLDAAEAKKRLETHGKNRLPEAKKKSALLRIAEQFINPLVLTLLAAAVIAVIVGVTTTSEDGVLARFGDAIA